MLLLTLALQCFGFSTLEPIQLAPDPYPLTFLSAEAASAKVEAASPYATQSPNISTEQALLIAGHHDQADPIPTPGIALAEPFANAGHVHPAPPARSKPALRAPPPGKSHQTNATPVVYARFKLDSPVAPNTGPGKYSGLTDEQFAQEIARRAEKKIGGTGAAAGSRKHSYAERFMKRYQKMTKQRTHLEVEESYLNGQIKPRGTPGSARPDLYDPITGNVYDYKFTTNPGNGISSRQQFHNAVNLPKTGQQVEINP